MTFRLLIQQAMREASADFATIVERKLLALLGTGGSEPAMAAGSAGASGSTPRAAKAKSKAATAKRAAPAQSKERGVTAKKTTTAKKVAPAKKGARAAKRPVASNGPPPTRAAIEAAILGVLATRSDLSKGPLMAAAKLEPQYAERVRTVLEFLRDAGKIKMSDKQHGSLYSLVSARAVDNEPGVAAYHDPTAT